MNYITKDRKTQSALRLFVYGTLKRGYWNHDRFCRGALYIQDAKIRGRLYQLPSGIPVLRIPDNDILAVGTSDPLADVATQERFSGQLSTEIACDEANWQMIHGELAVFPDPVLSLPPIDRLEGFSTGYPSPYRRVLVPISTEDGVQSVWCYIGSGLQLHPAIPLKSSVWHPHAE